MKRVTSPREPDAAETASAAGRVGVAEWFRPGEHARVEAALAGLRSIGVGKLRVGLSWADYHRPEGADWYAWLLSRLARDVEVLPCATYTPPSLGIEAKASEPPRSLKWFADFLDEIVSLHGHCFEWIELWNEPNNLNNWNWQHDPEWRLFSEMVGGAAYWMRRRGKRTVLGGTCPHDLNWLTLMCRRGVMEHIDAIGVHAFPGTWDPDWMGWQTLLEQTRQTLRREGYDPRVWITESGYSTWNHREAEQIHHFLGALAADADRVYWYSYQDLDDNLPSEEGLHFDDRHYHTGLVKSDGSGKLLFRALARGGIEGARSVAQKIAAPIVHTVRPKVLITGGAGFIGSNLADRLAQQGRHVLVYDSLAREHVDENLDWLTSRNGNRIAAEIADVRDYHTLRDAVRQASEIYHLAAQVAVTTSVVDPVCDFEVNARGTLNLLEAVRAQASPPPVVFTSTNKVYGHLLDLDSLDRGERRYWPKDACYQGGFDESQPIELYSPYGCSKGAADQYVLDYARIFRVPATVFRMSCIYGLRQFGTEDQGWVAHFLIRALQDQPITIYGDGRQVRDVLFVDDLIDALLLAQQKMTDLKGQVFNIGGGPANTVSLLELLDLMERLLGSSARVVHADPRPGDQLIYVADTAKFRRATGWQPEVAVKDGLARLARWLADRFRPTEERVRTRKERA